MKRRSLAVAVACLAWVLGSASPSWAPHLYRGPGGGCTPNDGALSDGGTGEVGATVMMLHNTFNDSETLGPVTFIEAGQAVTWTWNSAHCHSAKSADVGGFYTGYHYPAPTPSSPLVVPGFLEYPVPEAEPTLSYTQTFATPGVYAYSCEHHAALGMAGVVVVE